MRKKKKKNSRCETFDTQCLKKPEMAIKLLSSHSDEVHKKKSKKVAEKSFIIFCRSIIDEFAFDILRV
jgi:hypothetical protein